MFRDLLPKVAEGKLSTQEALASASAASGGATSRTIYRWMKDPITPAIQRERNSHRGRKPKLTAVEEKIIIGYAMSLRALHEPVSQRTLIGFANAHLGKKLSKPQVSALSKKYNWSSQRSLPRESRMTTEEVVDDAIEFLALLRDLKVPPNLLWVMDETGLWSNTVPRRTLNPRGGYDIFKTKLRYRLCSTLAPLHSA